MDGYFDEFRMNVKYYRDRRGMTQAELAVQADCSNGLIGNIEAGNTHPSFDTIMALARALGVHPADLFLRNASETRREIKIYLKETRHRELDRLVDSGFPL